MIDVSMAGASIILKSKNGLVVSNPITEFADDGNPVDIPNLEVAGGNMNLNGLLVTWTKPNPVQISFTLIPGSDSERALHKFLAAVHVGGKGSTVGEAFIESLVYKYPTPNSQRSTTGKNTNTITFSNGRLLSGPPAVGTNNEGKASSTTWTFMFESFSN